MIEGQRILVTGATGQVARPLVVRHVLLQRPDLDEPPRRAVDARRLADLVEGGIIAIMMVMVMVVMVIIMTTMMMRSSC